MRSALVDAHHEVGGFFAEIAATGAEAVPLFAARALPSGIIRASTFADLVDDMLDKIRVSPPLDGILVAPHGATVSELYPDADGYWLKQIRDVVGSDIPIIGTLDAHANLSQQMVENCDALVAYRTNPHLDQRARGMEAARLMVRTLRHEIRPAMSAVFLPLAISIERQCTEEFPLVNLYHTADEQMKTAGLLSNSVLLGFPYADVAEMGSAVLAIADGDIDLAARSARELAASLWEMRNEFATEFVSIEAAMKLCAEDSNRICLLDMGDNVGGGSSADGTALLSAIYHWGIGPSFGCLYDPDAVASCKRAGVNATLQLRVGGRSDNLHGDPLDLQVRIVSTHSGVFRESQPRHGGFSEFDQGPTVVCETESGLTLMLTSRRMVPFSLQQLTSCGLKPTDYRVLVAKGVNAPIAAYRTVCDRFIRVNTPGSTCADLVKLDYLHRRSPMFPWEKPDAATIDQLLGSD